MPKFKLLTTGNPKTVKGEKRGYLTFILHLAPADLSGHEVCRWRTKGCTKLCLNKTGHGGIFLPGETNAVQEARKRRTRFLFEDRAGFMAALVSDIERAIVHADRRDLTAVFRLNGTSDLVWEAFPVIRDGVQYENVFAAFPAVQFYDYTKAPYAARRHDIANYHLTFSYAETLKNRLNAREWFRAGSNVAVVFGVKRGAELPAAFRGAPVFDADTSDLRFLDKRGIAGLRAKGHQWKRESNAFVNEMKGVLNNG